MDLAASLQNDTAKTIYTYTVQIPYLNMAMAELQEVFEQHNVPATNDTTSSPITVNVGTTTITLPTDLVEIQQLHERLFNSNDDYTPMTRRDFLPKTTVITSDLCYWQYNGQVVSFIGANTARQVLVDYVQSLFVPITAPSDTITLINSKTFLAYRTAGLCSQFVGENQDRADNLNQFAILALDRALGINIKGTQSISTRRRPFRQAFKLRGW